MDSILPCSEEVRELIFIDFSVIHFCTISNSELFQTPTDTEYISIKCAVIKAMLMVS